MASLQIPFSRWDWPNYESQATTPTRTEPQNTHNHNHNHIHSNGHSHSSSLNHNHRSDVNCSHPKSNPIAASFSSLSAMLLEGQAVLAHQTTTAIWLFIGLSNGSIWKWTINMSNFLASGLRDLQAELVMTAHKSPIKALAMSKYRVDCTGEDNDPADINVTDDANIGRPKTHFIESLVSVDETGELAVWNCHDGRCLLHNLRATATGKNAGYPNSISISPNYEFCVLGGFSDKLVVLRLSTLEIAQIVEVSGGRIPRWVRSAGFLLQDDPNLLLDYLTLNFNAPANESLTARQFDPNAGKFVSPACPILPPTIPKDQLEEFSTCHLLTCSRANPGIAALVTKLHKVWLIDFLSGDFVQFSLDFEIDGVEFVRADLLLVWSKTGKLAFYKVIIQSGTNYNINPNDNTSEDLSRSKSPILGHVVRKLDIKCTFPIGNRLHLKLLSTATTTNPTSCASLLWIETIQCPQRKTQVSVVQVDFDPECLDRTVHLYRENDLSLNLLFSDDNNNSKIRGNSNNNTVETNILPPVTCTITMKPEWLIHGHIDGRISRKSILNFFSDEEDIISTPPPEEFELSSFSNCPITAMAAVPNANGNISIVAGDSQGQLQFWELSGDSEFKFLGASRCHVKKIIGITESYGSFYSWSTDGVVGMYQLNDGIYRCVHLFYPPASHLGLTGLYWRTSPDGYRCLLLDYRTTNSSSMIVHSNWDISNGNKLPDLNDSSYLETLSVSDLKIQVEGLNEGLTGKTTLNPYKSPENSQLFDGIATILGDGRQWPELPCHSLMFDIRLLAKKMKNSELLVRLAKKILSQFLAWGISERTDNICKEILRLSPNSSALRYGLLGANGNISLILNPPSRDRFWTLSPTLTASLQLSILLLLESLPKTEDSEQQIYSLVTFYAAQISDIPTKPLSDSQGNQGSEVIQDSLQIFRPAALSFISKFWQDPDADVQKAARILFSTTFARLSAIQRTSLIDYWKDYLPNSSHSNAGTGSSDGSRSVHRSAIILGIIGVQEPDSLTRSIKKHVAESLVALLLDGKRNIFRLAAVELMGRGYPIWLPFIHGASIFKLLYSWLIQLFGGDEQFYQTTLKALIHILTTTDALQTSENLSLVSESESGSVGSISRKSSSSVLSSSPLIMWLNDLNGPRDISQIERKCSIELLHSLLSFKPIVFRGYEQILVEIVMKLVEPNHPIYEEVTSHFGLISVHRTTQRLAVCLNDNSIAVYDMKTGNRIVQLQGHVHPCTLVAFNPERTDGKQLISYSFGEACIRWWQISGSSSNSTSLASSSSNNAGSTISGLFSSLTGGGSGGGIQESSRPGAKPVKIIIVQPELTDAIDCIPSGSVFKLNPINLNWNSKSKILEFRVGAALIQTVPIP